MSTPNITPSAKYSGNGVATEFAVPFPYLDKSYVSVYVKRGLATQVKLSSTDFDFTNDTYIIYPKAGSTDAILTSNDIIVVKRETPVKSDYVFDNQVRLFPEDVMNADDLSFQIIQEQADEINRAIKVSETSSANPDDIVPAIESIYSNLTQISAVGNNIDDINTCASNLTDIQNASTNAQTATTKASEASASATSASNYASNASASAGRAANSAVAAATSANLANIQNKITNCITEIPQNIKLELNNGTLVMKAGSKVYMPNGVGKFDELVTTVDKSIYSGDWSTGTYAVFCLVSGALSYVLLSNCSSGTTAPSTTSFNVWYDTTNNLVKNYNGGADTNIRYSFPIAIVRSTIGTGTTSIDQVFNGFGYIGSTVFALPGVKELIPNGRNADGSLKNIEFTVSSVFTRTFTWDISGLGQIFAVSTTGLSSSGTNIPFYQQEEIPPVIPYTYWYNPSENIVYSTGSGTTWYKTDLAVVGRIVGDNTGKITSFTPEQPVQLVKMSDKEIFNQMELNNISNTSGSISLLSNKIYKMNITSTTTFVLPAMNTNIYNQIKVMVHITGTPTIDWGTSKFFYNMTPSIEAGDYDFYFDYDPTLSSWIAGAVSKGDA